jgi:4Fe-4S ferredoxin
VNRTWEQRHNLIAVTEVRRAPRLLDIWSLLPRSNCRQCGEATCMDFAVGLLRQKWELADCLPLQTNSDFTDRLASLEVMPV